MPYDQALADHDAIEDGPDTAESTARIVELLRDLSRAAREHFYIDEQRGR